MKYALILITFIVLISGCVKTEQIKERVVPVPSEVVVIGSQSDVPVEDVPVEETKEFSIRATDSGFSPDTITVDKGDQVRLFITNLDTQDTDKFTRIGITGMNIESFYTEGTSVVLEFEAGEKGQFEFGDETQASRKGLIIVN